MDYLGISQKITGYLKPEKRIVDYLGHILGFKDIDWDGFVG